MSVEEFSISFQIKHPIEDLDFAAKKLGIVPFRIWKVGEKRCTPKGRRLDGLRKESYCCFVLKNDVEFDEAQLIEHFLNQLEIDPDYWVGLSKSGGSLNLIIYSESSSGCRANFDWRLLYRLAKLEISLGVDA